jgi:hypothetical protein
MNIYLPQCKLLSRGNTAKEIPLPVQQNGELTFKFLEIPYAHKL